MPQQEALLDLDRVDGGRRFLVGARSSRSPAGSVTGSVAGRLPPLPARPAPRRRASIRCAPACRPRGSAASFPSSASPRPLLGRLAARLEAREGARDRDPPSLPARGCPAAALRARRAAAMNVLVLGGSVVASAPPPPPPPPRRGPASKPVRSVVSKLETGAAAASPYRDRSRGAAGAPCSPLRRIPRRVVVEAGMLARPFLASSAAATVCRAEAGRRAASASGLAGIASATGLTKGRSERASCSAAALRRRAAGRPGRPPAPPSAPRRGHRHHRHDRLHRQRRVALSVPARWASRSRAAPAVR